MVNFYVEYLLANCITCSAKVIDYNNSKLWWRSIFRLGAWKRASFSKSSNPSLRRAVPSCTSSRDALLTRELSAQWYKLAKNASRRVISCPLSSIMRIDLDSKCGFNQSKTECISIRKGAKSSIHEYKHVSYLQYFAGGEPVL